MLLQYEMDLIPIYASQNMVRLIQFVLCKQAETRSNLWKWDGSRGLRSSNARSHRQKITLLVASGLIQAILNLATSAPLGLPFTPTIIQSGWTCSSARERLS